MSITVQLELLQAFSLQQPTPNFLIQESIKTWDGFYQEVLQEPIKWVHGHIIPSTKPGLGIELNHDIVKANSPYKGRKLHLSMNPKPYSVGDDLSDL